VQHCRRRTSSSAAHLSLEECAEIIGGLKRSYPKEYEVYSLAALAGAVLLPVVRAEFASWDPLADPERCVPTVRACRGILGDDGVGPTGSAGGDSGGETMSLYETLVWEHVVPKLRASLTQWEPRDAEPAVQLLAVWGELLPRWMCDSIHEQAVLPRLQAAVESWSPTVEATPVHAWLHPWLPVLGEAAMEPL
jgi:tuftelin-interacting protein 11